ncbi:MAG: glycoside hydrolase family 130 protein [Melioribacteraceae bacterium]|nr:glycoside hydrolase family 130 protein [Melioribacteraceae bacterium]
MNLLREKIKLIADPKRVILRFFFPGNIKRANNIINKVLDLSEAEVKNQLEDVMKLFNNRHKNFTKVLKANFNLITKKVPVSIAVSEDCQLLTGSYFTSEYSIEAAALFNPSIVPHFDQGNVDEKELRFILSQRATGEGHISSIKFCEGILSENGSVNLSAGSKYSVPSSIKKDVQFSKKFFTERLIDQSKNEFDFFQSMNDQFSRDEIESKLNCNNDEVINIADLVDSNYDCEFESELSLSEKVLFPLSKTECMGMEDARFVLFNEDSGDRNYYGTYTAYNGKNIKTQLISTKDFNHFKIRTLHGAAIKDKGFAIFPRKINGKYYITSRLDGENIYMMNSDDLYFWNNSSIIQLPEEPWQYVQLGNCGSPLETKDGWLLITHAVGPMRRYVISAILLDLNDPSKVIGRLNESLIEPTEEEREGYVPNVVYSCGSIIHNDNLIIPYAVSDSACGFARIELDEVINKMK